NQPSGLTVPMKAVDMAARYGGKVTFMYEAALQGFAIQLTEEQANKLAADPRVDYVEQDQIMQAVATQGGATWGIDRSDQRNLPLSGTYTYADVAGNGVRAYIIDPGILTAHSQYGGRALA